MDYDFSTHPNFDELGAGSGTRCISYSVSYSPEKPELFESNAVGFITFHSLHFDSQNTDKYHLEYNSVTVTPTHINFAICQYENSRIFRLKGNIIIVAQSARSKFKRDTLLIFRFTGVFL